MPPFAEIEPFLEALPQYKLIEAIRRAWDTSPDLRIALDAMVGDDCWMEPAEQDEMLKYNWEVDDDRFKFRIEFKNTPADGKVHIGGTTWRLGMSEVREMLIDGDGEFFFEDYEREHGCEECGAPRAHESAAGGRLQECARARFERRYDPLPRRSNRSA